MKKLFVTLLTLVLSQGTLAACVCGGGENIFVISRESSSGTRDGFESIAAFSTEEKQVIKSDLKSPQTNGVLTEVAKNKTAIGYASLASAAGYSGIKLLKYENTEATVANIQSDRYKMQHPSVIVTKKMRRCLCSPCRVKKARQTCARKATYAE